MSTIRVRIIHPGITLYQFLLHWYMKLYFIVRLLHSSTFLEEPEVCYFPVSERKFICLSQNSIIHLKGFPPGSIRQWYSNSFIMHLHQWHDSKKKIPWKFYFISSHILKLILNVQPKFTVFVRLVLFHLNGYVFWFVYELNRNRRYFENIL